MSKFYVALPTHLKKHSFKHSGEKDPTCITVTHYTYLFLLMTEPWKPVGCYQNRGRALGDILLGVAGNATMISKLDACKKKAASKAGLGKMLLIPFTNMGHPLNAVIAITTR